MRETRRPTVVQRASKVRGIRKVMKSHLCVFIAAVPMTKLFT